MSALTSHSLAISIFIFHEARALAPLREPAHATQQALTLAAVLDARSSSSAHASSAKMAFFF